MSIDGFPVGGQPLDIQRQRPGCQVLDGDTRQDEKTLIVGDVLKPFVLRSSDQLIHRSRGLHFKAAAPQPISATHPAIEQGQVFQAPA